MTSYHMWRFWNGTIARNYLGASYAPLADDFEKVELGAGNLRHFTISIVL